MTTITEQQLEDLAHYLPSDRREAIHVMVVPGTPTEYVSAYYARYGAEDLLGCAELAGVSVDVVIDTVDGWIE